MKLSITFLLLLSFLSCQDDDEPIERVVTQEGRLFKNCEKDPYAGMTLNFYYIRDGSLLRDNKKEFHSSTTTDSSGFYSFSYKPKWDYIEVENDKGDVVFRTAPPFKSEGNYAYAENYSRTKLTHPVKIKTDRPFTEEDTIFMGAEANFGVIFTLNGPFENNQTSQTDLLNFVRVDGLIAGFHQSIESKVIFFWEIGIEQYNKISTNAAPFAPPNLIYNVPQRLCDGDTVIVDLRGL
ncbi:MAG: hypothetical protein RJQ00_09600 [Vicingaceae bacterium]